MKDMKKIFVSIILVSILFLSGCSQMMAKKFGGDYTLELPEGERLVNIT